MPFSVRCCTLFLVALMVTFSGCYNKSIRHLASDASLIKVGSTTRNEVLMYLGEPDQQRFLEDGAEEWLYVEEMPSDLQHLPVAGRFFDGRAQDSVVIQLKNNIVQSCKFRKHGRDEYDWADDYSWQEKEE